MNILDIFFPSFCIGCNRLNTLLCPDCYELIEFSPFQNTITSQSIDTIFSACLYDGIIKKCVSECKYQGVKQLSLTMAHIMQYSLSLPKCDLLVPIPLYARKKRVRGFNQSELMAQELAILNQTNYLELLVKNKNTYDQMSLTERTQRESNLDDCFQINQVKLDEYLSKNTLPQSVLLIDDVCTTGTTLEECAIKLKEIGVSQIYAATLAHGA